MAEPIRITRDPAWSARAVTAILTASPPRRYRAGAASALPRGPGVGYSARSGAGLRAGLRQPPVSAMPVEYLTPAIEDRAVEVLTLLADRGQHRAPSVPDLIIATTAELAGVTVLHCDKDFDLIASVTGQAAEWLRVA